MAEISGTALAAACVGGVFIYGGILGKSPLAAAQSVIRGNNPKSVPQSTGLTAGASLGQAPINRTGPGQHFGTPSITPGSAQAQFQDFCLHSLLFTKAGTAGAMGNVERESGWDAGNNSGDGGTSGGLCQWHLDRFSGLQHYAAHHGLAWQSVQAQLGWMRVELSAGYADVRLVMMGATSPESAAAYWASRFEGCTDCHAGTAEMAQRQAAARRYYNQMG